jgi:hypothetical protein
MNILHLPHNIASQISVSVRAQRDLGVNARGLATSQIVNANGLFEPLPAGTGSMPRRAAQLARRVLFVTRAVQWADVVHWHYHWALPAAFDLRLARRLGKRRIVEFWGSDIRIPEVEMRDNPYYARIFPGSEYSGDESAAISRRRQRQFAGSGVPALISCPSLRPHLFEECFPRPHFARQRVYLADYAPAYPDRTARKPVVLHSPTAPRYKGTPAIEAAVEQLRRTHILEYRRVHGVPHAEAKRMMQECDIFVDQLGAGAHGLAALEAMAYGKPVVCYIKPALRPHYPPELPIVSATLDNIPEVLARLLEDGALRYELGRRGRAYVEQYHDAHLIARQLQVIYLGLQR